MADNNLLKAKALLYKYREGTCTDEEKAWVEEWYLNLNRQQTDLSDQELVEDLRDLQSRLTDITAQKKGRTKYALPAIAASVLLISGLGLYFYKINEKPNSRIFQTVVIADVPAGTNKAILTLSDGRRIALSDAQTGMFTNDGNANISIEHRGQVVYGNSSVNKGGDISMNTMQTPKGGQFSLTLSDGTKVRLNAGSTLKYPAQFTGNVRSVELIGEGYFEVAHNKAIPFIVRTAGQSVNVLGTHFNVNSYAEEGRTVTTLEEGSVQVRAGATQKILRPGQQSIVPVKGNMEIRQANMQTALAWKNNEMVFKDAGIREVMRQIARWYDLEIVYEGNIPDDTITGSIDRQSNLSTVLKMFSTIQIHFTLVETQAGKKLIITP